MRTGGCQCGEVRYECEGEPLALYVCHCRECRRQSASAFGISLIVPRKGFPCDAGCTKILDSPYRQRWSGRMRLLPELRLTALAGVRGRVGDSQHQGRIAGRSTQRLRRDPYLDIAKTAGHGHTGRRPAISGGAGVIATHHPIVWSGYLRTFSRTATANRLPPAGEQKGCDALLRVRDRSYGLWAADV